jgi:hypothetical protein
MKISNNNIATFVKRLLVKKDILKGIFKWFMKTRRSKTVTLQVFSCCRSDLRRHIDCLPEKSQPHQCSICEKNFSHEGKLKRHIQRIHKENN